MSFLGNGLIIPVVAIIAVFAVPITAIITDFKRRKLVSEERRAMIEKGIEPPPLEESHLNAATQSVAQRRERSLYHGVTCLMLGVGLGVASWLLSSVLEQSYIPPRLAGPLAVGASVLASLGIGNLIYVAVTRTKGEPL